MQPVLSIQSLWLLSPLVKKIIRAREESLQSLHWYRTWKRTLEGVNPSLKCQVRLSYPSAFPTAEQRRGACARASLRPPLSPPTPSPLLPPAPPHPGASPPPPCARDVEGEQRCDGVVGGRERVGEPLLRRVRGPTEGRAGCLSLSISWPVGARTTTHLLPPYLSACLAASLPTRASRSLCLFASAASEIQCDSNVVNDIILFHIEQQGRIGGTPSNIYSQSESAPHLWAESESCTTDLR